jgi:hypothetical protein
MISQLLLFVAVAAWALAPRIGLKAVRCALIVYALGFGP